MKRHPYTTPSLLLLLVSLALPGCSKTPEDHFNQGKSLFEKGDTQGAILELKNTLQTQPNNGEARLLLGKTYLAVEAYADAEKELSRARDSGIATDKVLPLLAWAYLRMGEAQKALDLGIPPGSLNRQDMAAMQATRAEALIQLGKRAEAEIPLAAAEQADSGHPRLLVLKARLAVDKKAPDEAKQYLDTALKRDPTYLHAYYLKAALLEAEGKLDEALQTYQQALKYDPKAFRAYLAIADAEFRRGQTEACEKALQAAEKAAPNHPLVRYTRGMFELRRNDLKAANDALLEVLRVAPDYMPAQLASAMVNLGLGNYEQATKNAGKVLQAIPDNVLAAKVLAASQLRLGNARDALKTITPFLGKHGGDARLQALAGEIHFQLKDFNKAMAYLDKAVELEPGAADLKTRRAAGHLALGEDKEALSDLERAAGLSDKPGQADLALVALHIKNKAFDKALEAIAKLEKKAPDNPMVHNLRGVVLLGKQDKAGARNALEKALALDPKFYPAAVNLARLDLADKQLASAKKRFEAILAQDANNLQAMLALADLALLEKQEKERVAWLEKAAKAHPDALTPKASLTRHYLDKQDFAKAVETAKQAVRDNPEDPRALDLLGATQMVANDAKSAVDTYTQLTQKAPNTPEAYLRLGLAQLAAKAPIPARQSLNKALALQPDFIAAMNALLGMEMSDKKPDAAMQWAKKIQSAQPKSPLGFEREGDILMTQQRHAQAAGAYQAAVDKGLGTQGLLKLHTALTRAGNAKAAQAKLDEWIKSHPQDLTARVYYAGEFMRNQQDKLAAAQYEEILRQQPAHILALNNLAVLYHKAADPRALPTAEKALKLAPKHPGIQDTVGWILVEQGQLPRALELLRSAAQNAAQIPSVRYHFGAALAKAGQKAEARKELEAALAGGRPFPEMEAARALLKELR